LVVVFFVVDEINTNRCCSQPYKAAAAAWQHDEPIVSLSILTTKGEIDAATPPQLI
jgi:hypothetical protein